MSGLFTHASRSGCAVIAAASIGACSPAPQWVAVVSDEPTIHVFDGDLKPIDTLALWTVAGSGAIPDRAQFAADGASLLVTAIRPVRGSEILRLRRTDGALVDHAEVGVTTRGFTPLRDTKTVVFAGSHRDDDSEGALLFMSHRPLRELRTVRVCANPIETVPLAHGERVYVLCGSDRVTEVDPDLGIAVKTVEIGAAASSDTLQADRCGAVDATLSGNEAILLVTCSVSSELLYLDRVTLSPLASLSLSNNPAAIAVSPSGAKAVIALSAEGRILIVDLERRVVATTVEITGRPLDVAFAASDRWAFITADEEGAGYGWVLKLDVGKGLITARARTAALPRSVAVWPGIKVPLIAWSVQ